MTWLREKWAWILGGLAAVAGIVVFILTFGRKKPARPTLPPRPPTPDVHVPEPADVNTTPADDYHEAKTEPGPTTADDLVDDINRRRG